MKKKNSSMLVLIFVIFLGIVIIPMQSLFADAAPPEEPFGGDIVPGDTTQVQMVSEVVEITVLEEEKTRDEFGFSRSVADVTASFVMLNHGDEDEKLSVHFPLNMSFYNYADWPIPEISDFQVFVNEEELVWERNTLPHPLNENSDSIEWAVFEILFPVGELVELKVSYQMPGVGYYPRTTFTYIFQTGGGWLDVIESADLIVNLPFEATQNTIAYPEMLLEGALFDGNQITWHFEDLEPTEDDNFHITIMSPRMVEEIEKARLAAYEVPIYDRFTSLAELYYTVSTYKGMFVDESWGGYIPLLERTLEVMHEIDPGNLEVRASYAVAVNLHRDLHSYGRILDYPVPVDETFILDVMYEIIQIEQDDRGQKLQTAFWQLDFYFYYTYGEDYLLMFDDYEPQGVVMPAPALDAIYQITGLHNEVIETPTEEATGSQVENVKQKKEKNIATSNLIINSLQENEQEEIQTRVLLIVVLIVVLFLLFLLMIGGIIFFIVRSRKKKN